MADILFVHNNFPAQLGFLAEAMRDRGHRCYAISSKTGRKMEGVPLMRWQLRRGTTPGIFKPATRAEADMLRGRAAAACAMEMRDQGFDPSLIVAHPGWGETLFLKDIFPRARIVLHGEFFYRAQGADVGFDPEFNQLDAETKVTVHAKNAGLALAYVEADRIVCPTEFQRSVMPQALRPAIDIIHEGVDVEKTRRRPDATFALPDGRTLDRSTPVVTFVSRRLEPMRGFHILLRALPKFLEAVPDAHVLVIGDGTRAGYGAPAPGGGTWREHLWPEVEGRLDASRVHFTGRVGYDELIAAMSISAAHVYYTYPFVLSWSLIEAMSAECLIVGSDTAPLHDAIENGRNGILLDFFDPQALADQLVEACRRPGDFEHMRRAARETVLARFDRERLCRPAWLALLDEMLATPK